LDELGALHQEDLKMYEDLEEMKKIISTMYNGEDMLLVLLDIMQEMKEILRNMVSLQNIEVNLFD
jgi:vesicle coat complex subunit